MIINTPTIGIGKSTIDKIAQHAYVESISCYDAAKSLLDKKSESISISTGPAKNVNNFIEIIEKIKSVIENIVRAK